MKLKQLSLFDYDPGDPTPIKEILYTSALNGNGNVVLINDAEKGDSYFCPKCNKNFILRKSGKTGKGSRRPHFAHKNLSPNCTPEGVLHYSFKKLLVEFLEKYSSESKPLIINWKCDACSADYPKTNLTTNLLVKTATIKEEYNLKVCRPDIALLDIEGEVIAVIEIVVTHEPEENVLRYYKENGITLVKINLLSDDDLHRVQEKILNPDVVNLCLNSKCRNYMNHVAKKRTIISELVCNRCSHPMLDCHVEINSVFGTIRTTELTNSDIKFAQSKGVRFKFKQDKSVKKNFFSIICKTCEKTEEQAKLYFQIIAEQKKIYNKKIEEQRRKNYKKKMSNRYKFRF